MKSYCKIGHMRTFRPTILITLALLALGTFLRINDLSHGLGFHPDERHIIMTLGKMSWDNLSPGFFAYGSLPFYLAFFGSHALAALTPWQLNYENLFIFGRALSVLFGLASIVLTGVIAWQTFRNRNLAIIATLLLTFNALHIQLSRFFAFDIILAALCTATLSAALLIMRRKYRVGLPLSALFLGLALATKISALSLLGPIAFAIASSHNFNWRKAPRGLAQFLFIAIAGVFVFALTEPYAFWEWRLFVAQNLEQINMTRGNWRPPYTIQYWNTIPWLYPLEQMAKGTFWWPAFIAVVAGIVLAPITRTSDQSREKWLLLIWIGISFFSIGGLQVKFPRYLLPIYPALCIFGAWALDYWGQFISLRSPASMRRPAYVAATLVVLLPSLLFAIAFRGIYDHPHSYINVSHWIYKNVPRDSTIVGFHWDDKIPLTLPGFEARAYGYKIDDQELRIYELPDNPAKLALMAETLVKADYLAWPTQRINGSLPRVPEEYPRSLKLLQLIYNGKLGFNLIHSEKVRPRLFGFEWRDDTLDESISVYDHPKVLIFKKSERLTAEEISERVESALAASPATPTRDQFLNKDYSSSEPVAQDVNQEKSQLIPILCWFAILEALAFFSWPMVALLFPNSPDRGYLLSKTVGVLLFGLLSWALAFIGAIQLTSSGLLLVCTALALGGLFACSRELNLYYKLKEIFEQRAFAVEVLLLTTTLVLMIIKSFQPEIFWGEKPMDFGLLNYFLRLEHLPPEDPWAAGYQLQYYYLGTFLISLLIKLSGVSAGIGFNLGMVLVSTLTVSGACAIFSSISRRLGFAIFAGLTLFLASNFEVLRLWLENRIHSFDLFWASSRVLHPPAFAEYPLWSFLFGDLHAHVIAYPFTLLLVGLGVSMTREWFLDERSTNLPAAALYGLVLGSLFALNTWDCISYSLFSSLLFAVALIPNQRRISWMTFSERLKVIFLRAVTAVACMLVVIVPFSRSATQRVRMHWGSVMREEFNFASELLLFHGHWFFLLLAATLGLVVLLWWKFRRQSSPLRALFLGILTFLPFALSIMSLLRGADGIPWPALIISAAIILCSGLPTLYPIRRPEVLIVALCGITSGILLAGSEIFFLFDRMNTIFKFYSALGTMLSIGALSAILYFIEEVQDLPYRVQRRWIWASPLLLFSMMVLVTVGLASAINIQAMTTFRRLDQVTRPTLDGTAFLERNTPEEAALFRWINSAIPGTPILLEAQGASYGQFNRVQMNTGLPVLVGWEHHIKQRGVSFREYERRVAVVKAIYDSSDLEQAKTLIQENGIELLVVGKLEQLNYSQEGLAKFAHPGSGFYKLFEQGGTILYAPPSSKFHPDYHRKLRIKSVESW